MWLVKHDHMIEEIATRAKCPKKEPKHQPKMAEHGPESYLNTNSMGRHRMLTIKQIRVLAKDNIFDLERAVAVETPQLGHATYLFSKPTSMTNFLAIYSLVTREDILQNRSNVAEKLGFLGRLIHGLNPRAWLKKLKVHLGETVDSSEASD